MPSLFRLSSNPDDLFLGIDVGGTDVKVGLVDSDGTLLDRHRTATPVLGSPQRVFAHTMEFAADALKGKESKRLAAVGLAVPGVLDTNAFQLREVVNLPGWLNVPLLDLLSEATQLPSAVINDANAAAFAEHARLDLGSKSLALVTLGTGVGCGLVVAGEPCGGDHGCAGELGHIAITFGDDAIPCTCGSRGHLESYAGAGGVMKRMRDRYEVSDGTPSWAAEMADSSPRDIATAADAGDIDAIAVIDETAAFVGRAIGMLCQSVNPAVVLIGGAMTFGGEGTAMGERFLNGIRDEVRATTLVQVGQNVTIDYASLKNDAGILGAAKLASVTVKQDNLPA